jgi:hypothetical protein
MMSEHNEDRPTSEEKQDPSPQEDDNDDIYDSDSDSLDVPLVMVSPHDPLAKASKPQQPPDELEWDDTAILSCLDLTMATHDDDTKDMEWPMPRLGNAIDNEIISTWRPNSLKLPVWAVDPFVAS